LHQIYVSNKPKTRKIIITRKENIKKEKGKNRKKLIEGKGQNRSKERQVILGCRKQR